MSTKYTIILFLLISTKILANMNIDFKNDDWKYKLDSLDGQKISSITFENYNNELTNVNYNIEVRNLTFKNSLINKIPSFLNNKKVYYIWFSDCKFLNPFIGLAKIKSLSRINFSGNSIKNLPKDLDQINDLLFISISSTSIKSINIDFSKLHLIQEFILRSNEQLFEFQGDFGQCNHLKEFEIFECDMLKAIDISQNKSIKKIRFGSKNPEFKLQKGFDKLINLETVMIDNYRSSNFSIDFIKEKPIKELKIFCPLAIHLEVIKELKPLTNLKIEIYDRLKCPNQSFLFKSFTSLPNLTNLTISLQGLKTSKEFVDYITSCKHLKNVKVLDVGWNKKEMNYALSNVPKKIKVTYY